MDEVIAIGLALLGIIGWTWLSLNNISQKLDKLLQLLTKTDEKEKDANHTNST